MFNEHFIVLRKAPFWLTKWPILWDEKHHIAPQYRLYRTAKWALSENKMSIFGLRYGVYEAVVRAEIVSIRRDLTSIHTYFTKIFCQNYVKKNRKFVF